MDQYHGGLCADAEAGLFGARLGLCAEFDCVDRHPIQHDTEVDRLRIPKVDEHRRDPERLVFIAAKLGLCHFTKSGVTFRSLLVESAVGSSEFERFTKIADSY